MKRLPDFLKRPIIDTDKTKTVRKILKTHCLNTVCESARCPNKNECYTKNTATFLIMGNVCTRNCRFCNISTDRPKPLDENEPKHVAKAIQELNLKYAVITSVTRDDLPDGGAEHFAKCIKEIREAKSERQKAKEDPANLSLRASEESSVIQENTPHPNPLPQGAREMFQIKIEILTPDFKGNTDAIDKIIKSDYPPDVFNHNIETVPRLYKIARPQAIYQRSLDVLKYVKFNCGNSNILTKSGIMVGLGETIEELTQTLTDLKNIDCDIVTIGQYIQPSKEHLPVAKFYTLEEFEELKALAKKIGIKNYQIGPLVRSSYNAAETANK